MKKNIAIALSCSLFISPAYSQLIVESNGNVGVKYTNAQLVKSYFSVNSPGDPHICSFIYSIADSINKGLRLTKRGAAYPQNGDYNMGVDISVKSENNSPKKTYGCNSGAYKSIASTSGRTYGIYGAAGNATSGWNYGIFGTLFGTSSGGAGVFGSSLDLDGGMNTIGRYAGFFHGDVKATDAMFASVYNTTSDFRLKENIESIDSESIDNLMKLNVVKYNLKQLIIDTGDTATTQEYYYTNDSKLLERKHYGLIAQELKEIYPDLVYESEDGYLSVNYMEIIPILVKTIQDLKDKVDNIYGIPEKTAQRNEKAINATDILTAVVLYQNNPNPFTENTVVRCFIPDGITNATLYIYDMNGHQIDSRTIFERGNVSVIIEGSSLDAGMYLYSLITDGMVVDTKRMILTK